MITAQTCSPSASSSALERCERGGGADPVRRGDLAGAQQDLAGTAAWNVSMPPTLTAPERVAVVALGDRDEERPVLAALRRRLVRHLQRRFDGARAVAGVEDPAQRLSHRRRAGAGRGLQQLLGQRDARLVGQPEEGGVRDLVQLRAYGRVDLRHAMAVDA